MTDFGRKHGPTHEDAGRDEIDTTDLAGHYVASGYVDRGDPSASDFDHNDLTIDGTWNDLDLSSVVTAPSALVHIRIKLIDDATNSEMLFRKKGNSNTANHAAIRTLVAAIFHVADIFVLCNSDRIIQYRGTNEAFSEIYLNIRGWFS